MFYSTLILQKTGPYAHIWLAATLDKKLNKAQVFAINIEQSVDSIINPTAPLALRLSANLYLMTDCNEAMTKMKNAFKPSVVDLAEEAQAAPAQAITLANFDELDIGLDVDAGAFLEDEEEARGAARRDDDDEWAAAASNAIARRRDITLAEERRADDEATPVASRQRPPSSRPGTEASSIELMRDEEEEEAAAEDRRRSGRGLSAAFRDEAEDPFLRPAVADDDAAAAVEGFTDLEPLAPEDLIGLGGEEEPRPFHDDEPLPPPVDEDFADEENRRRDASLGPMVDDLEAIEDREAPPVPRDDDDEEEEEEPPPPPPFAEEKPQEDEEGGPKKPRRKKRAAAAVDLEEAELSLPSSTIKGWLADPSALVAVKTAEDLARAYAVERRRVARGPTTFDDDGDDVEEPTDLPCAVELDRDVSRRFATRVRWSQQVKSLRLRKRARLDREQSILRTRQQQEEEEDQATGPEEEEPEAMREEEEEEKEEEEALPEDQRASLDVGGQQEPPRLDINEGDVPRYDDEPPPMMMGADEFMEEGARPEEEQDEAAPRAADERESLGPIMDLEELSYEETAARARAVEREWHPNTVKVVKLLREGLEDADVLSFDDLTRDATKRTAVGAFVELLHLKTWDFVGLTQAEPYGDIQINPATCFHDNVPDAQQQPVA